VLGSWIKLHKIEMLLLTIILQKWIKAGIKPEESAPMSTNPPPQREQKKEVHAKMRQVEKLPIEAVKLTRLRGHRNIWVPVPQVGPNHQARER
jgi:hypothetical protein